MAEMEVPAGQGMKEAIRSRERQVAQALGWLCLHIFRHSGYLPNCVTRTQNLQWEECPISIGDGTHAEGWTTSVLEVCLEMTWLVVYTGSCMVGSLRLMYCRVMLTVREAIRWSSPFSSFGDEKPCCSNCAFRLAACWHFKRVRSKGTTEDSKSMVIKRLFKCRRSDCESSLHSCSS